MKKGNKGTAATDQTRIGGRRSRSGLVLFTTNITLRWSWNLAPGGERILPALIPAFSPGAKVPRPPGIANVPLILRDSVPWHDGGKRPPCHRRSSPRSNVRPLFLTPPASGNLQIPGMRENLCSGLFSLSKRQKPCPAARPVSWYWYFPGLQSNDPRSNRLFCRLQSSGESDWAAGFWAAGCRRGWAGAE